MKESKIVKELFKMVFFFAGLFVMFYVLLQLLSTENKNKWLYEKDNASSISVDKEIALGNVMDQYIVSSNNQKVLDNKLADSIIWVLSSRLKQQLVFSEYDYKIKILDNPQVNAFAIPGGRIYIYKGLISFCDTPEQLAAVLAHEMGHVEKRHVVSKLIKEFSLTILFSILSGGDAILLTDLWQSILSSSFDRKQEKEADMFALALLEKASISPRASASFFRKLNNENLSYNENLEIVMTHPHNNARIKMALTYKISENFTSKTLEVPWKKLKEDL